MLDAVKTQILSQLEQTQQTPKLQKKIQSLLAAQKKLTHYAPAYKPAPPAIHLRRYVALAAWAGCSSWSRSAPVTQN